MVQTRKQGLVKRQSYRKRVKLSQCRGKTSGKCRKRNGCKVTMKGRRRSYCRKVSNKHL
jgi:hypothetical protein